MNELLTEMKKYTDECKERVKDLDFEQIKALEERFDVIIMKGIHWSSVKELSCPKAIDFVPEAYLKFWSIYMKSIPCSSIQ